MMRFCREYIGNWKEKSYGVDSIQLFSNGLIYLVSQILSIVAIKKCNALKIKLLIADLDAR